jgi:glutathione S-transferase
MEVALDRLEAALATSPWLSGSAYGLADVSWVVNAHRLSQARYPLEARRKFRAWYEKAAARPAFERAVAAYQP